MFLFVHCGDSLLQFVQQCFCFFQVGGVEARTDPRPELEKVKEIRGESRLSSANQPPAPSLSGLPYVWPVFSLGALPWSSGMSSNDA